MYLFQQQLSLYLLLLYHPEKVLLQFARVDLLKRYYEDIWYIGCLGFAVG